MEIYDVSVPVRETMPVYDGNPGVSLTRTQSIAAGDHANVTRLDLGAHTGTHVDAPLHFIDEGAGTETIPLEPLVGDALVVDATGVEGDALGEDALRALDIPTGTERLIFKTRNSKLWDLDHFTRGFIRLDGSGARYLIELGARLVGIDYLSIGNEDAHRELLRGSVVPIEGLDLRGIEPGRYRLICLPVRLVGSDGAPARAVLVRD